MSAPLRFRLTAWPSALRFNRLERLPQVFPRTIPPVTTQTITVAGIASAEAWGTAKLNLRVTLSGISSAEAFGTAKIQLVVKPSGIATAEAFGTAKLNLKISPTGISSSEAFGTPTIREGIAIGGIASAEAWGTAKIRLVIATGGIASAEAWGTPSLRAAAIVLVGGIPSAEAWGNPTVSTGVQPVPPTVVVGGGARRRQLPEPPREPLLIPLGVSGSTRARFRTRARPSGVWRVSARSRWRLRATVTVHLELRVTVRAGTVLCGEANPRPYNPILVGRAQPSMAYGVSGSAKATTRAAASPELIEAGIDLLGDGELLGLIR